MRVKLIVDTIADLGLVGMPNAGKSTLISSITRSRPKIASYAFTTINPNLGQIKFVDNKNISIVDIPGLIEGASENKGLGHEFLNHCVRSKIIIFVIDMSLEGLVPPWEQYRILKKELSNYSKEFESKQEVIVGTKEDLKGAKENAEGFEILTGKKPILVSSKTSKNLSQLIRELREMVHGDHGPQEGSETRF